MCALKSQGVHCQWYQTEGTVTASIKLNPPPTRGKITVSFQEKSCTVFDGGVLYWEAHLPHAIVPTQSRISVGRSRSEVKMTKAERHIRWEEFEVSPPCTNSSATPTMNDTNSLSNNYVLEDVIFVDHVHHDFYDMHSRVKVLVEVGGILDSTCKVTFGRDSMEVKFQTRSERFLRMYEDHSKTTFFVWKIPLFGSIVSSECSYKVLPRSLEILLVKTSTARWKTLSPSLRRDSGITRTRGQDSDNIPPSADPSGGVATPSVLNMDPGVTRIREQDRINTPPPTNPTGGVASNHNSHDLRNDEGMEQESDQGAELAGSNWNDLNAVTDESRTAHSENVTSNNLQTNTTLDTTISNRTLEVPFSNEIKPNLSSSTSGYSSESSEGERKGMASSSGSGGSGPSLGESRRVTTTYQATNNFESTESFVHANGITVVATGNPSAATSPRQQACDDFSQQDQFSKPSRTGLVNIGNSCFMSSVVQCLSNTAPLRNYFMSGRYIHDINKSNPLGFQGQLASCFASTLKNLWSNEFEYYSLRKLKSVVAARSENFGGYQQQDSHEFMSYLLDGLHEDLNRVRDKPVTPPIESTGIPDAKLAEKAWQVHRMRNDSYFVDNFQGQFKSTLVCPVCQNVSVTFDPFMSLSVPIPRNLRRLPIFFVPRDPAVVPRRYILKLPPEANLELLKASVARKTGISMLQLRMFEIFNNKFHKFLSDNQQPIASIKDNDVIIVCESLPQRPGWGRSREQVVEINIIQRLKVALFPTKCAFCGRHSNEDSKLLRCGKCKAVGYCNRTCQGQDWAEHKMKCRKGRPTPVGLPFLISLSPSQFTYARLSNMAQQFARRSVEVHVEPHPPPRPSPEVETEQGEASPPEKEKLPLFEFVPVDRFADNEEGTKPLKDTGDAVLGFRGQYLAMDWQNQHKGPGSVVVKPKDVLDHEVVSVEFEGRQTSANQTVTLDQCIELFTQPETLSKEEAWFCSKCKQHREATKQISIWKLPPVLIIHLKRFSYSGNYLRDKLKDQVDFPISGLDMTPFMLGEASSLLSNETPPIYDLYATVNHYGAVFMGHYIAQVKPEGMKEKMWLEYDDEKVTTKKESEVVDTSVYLLFYRHRGKRK